MYGILCPGYDYCKFQHVNMDLYGYFQVVDARAGPGTKSIMKMKSRNKEERKFKKKHKHKKRIPPPKPPCSPGGLSDDILSMYQHSGYLKYSFANLNQRIVVRKSGVNSPYERGCMS